MKINQVLVEAQGATVSFAFGRFNPAHQGHIEVWRTVEQAGANWFIGTNATTIGPNDPLTFEQKSAWMEEIYPPIAGHIVAQTNVLTLAAYIFKKLRNNESTSIAYITDATDWAWSGKLLNQYNGVEGAHGYYKFAEIIHVPSPRVSSATALRDAARADDRVAFYHASGTDPKAKVAGLTYFDTVKQACEKYPLPVKRIKKTEAVGDLDEHIVKVKGGWELKSKHGDKNLGKYPTRAGAEKRERQVQYFKHMDEDEQKTVAKTWDQMTPQEKSSGVKGRTVWNEKTKKYYTVFDVPVKEVDEASLATMRDYFAGDENARDPMDITKQRLHFAKDKNTQPTMDKRFHSQAEYEQWLAQNKLKPISHAKGWELINKRKQ